MSLDINSKRVGKDVQVTAIMPRWLYWIFMGIFVLAVIGGARMMIEDIVSLF